MQRNFHDADAKNDRSAFRPDAPSEAPYALQRAAELAFASGDTASGLDILREIVHSESVSPRTTMQKLLRAVAGSIAGELVVGLLDHGISLDYSRPTGEPVARERPVSGVDWPSNLNDALVVAEAAWPAVVASAQSSDALAILPPARPGSFAGMLFDGLSGTLGYRASRALFSRNPAALDATAIAAIDERWERQALEGLARAEREGSLPVDTLDLGWLAILVGASRAGLANAPGTGRLPPQARFLRELASDIARLTRTSLPGLGYTEW